VCIRIQCKVAVLDINVMCVVIVYEMCVV
jgi:hypothetical protein